MFVIIKTKVRRECQTIEFLQFNFIVFLVFDEFSHKTVFLKNIVVMNLKWNGNLLILLILNWESKVVNVSQVTSMSNNLSLVHKPQSKPCLGGYLKIIKNHIMI